jgi:hypothetical protein
MTREFEAALGRAARRGHEEDSGCTHEESSDDEGNYNTTNPMDLIVQRVVQQSRGSGSMDPRAFSTSTPCPCTRARVRTSSGLNMHDLFAVMMR